MRRWTGQVARGLALGTLAAGAVASGCATEPGNAGVAEEDVEDVEVASDAVETMTDRCSAEVAIVPSYGALPSAPGTVVLVRDARGYTGWTEPFRVQLGGSGHIRWWCHSTTGNFLDPGTWRIKDVGGGVVCDMSTGELRCQVEPLITVGSSAWEGWTPERSRCDDRSTLIRARLGPNRLLQIQCLGR